ncbi:MAG: hypothetical protein EHM61_23925, partial [Acidobacteria bacterium]
PWPLPTTLLVAEADADDPHWVTTLAALQGLVNRKAPKGQMVWLDLLDCRFPPCSPHGQWLEYYRQKTPIQVTRVSSERLLQIAREEAGINYYIVFDPETARGKNIDAGRTCTINIACTVSGLVGNAIPVHPDDVSRLRQLGYQLLPDSFLTKLGAGAAVLRRPDAFDLREQWTSAHSDSPWKTRQDAYEWAINSLLPLTGREAVALVHDLEARPTEAPGHNFEPWLYDYSVGAGYFHFFFEPSPTPANPLNLTPYDRLLFAQLLQKRGPLTMVRGWHGDEGDYIRLLSEKRCFNGGMAWMPNLSVHGALSPYFQLDKRPRPSSPPLEAKIYLTFTFTDGDQAGVLYRNFWGSNGGGSLWADPVRGKFPINWTLNALLFEAARGIVRYFFDEASPNDTFVADLPAGYAWFDEKRFGDSLPAYLEMANCYLGATGLRVADFTCPMEGFIPIADSTLTSRLRYLTHADAIREGYGGGGGYQGVYWPEGYPLVPYIRTMFLAGGGGYGGETVSVEQIARQIEEWTHAPTGAVARPLFVHLTWVNWFTSPSDMAKCLELLEHAHPGEYKLVTMDQFVSLTKEAKQRGLFPISFRPRPNGQSWEEAPYLWEDHGSKTNTRDDPPPIWRKTTGGYGQNFVTYKFNVYPSRRARVKVEISGSDFNMDASPDNKTWTGRVIRGSGDRQSLSADVSRWVNPNGCFYVRFTGETVIWGAQVEYGAKPRKRDGKRFNPRTNTN